MARKWLFVFLILSTIYIIAGLIYYTNDTSTLEGHPIFAAIYLYLVTGHGVIYALGLFISWLGFGLRKKGMIGFGTLLCIIAGIIFFPSLLVVLPLSIFIFIFNRRNQKEKPIQ